jgi:GxxExxY protein
MNADGRRWTPIARFFDGNVPGAVFDVANTLGAGFLEKIYERALLKELHLRGIPAVSQASCSVVYKDYRVGDHFADILVEDALAVELKCVDA